MSLYTQTIPYVPLLRVCYYRFYSYVFRCANKEKSYALALAVAKAFYLAYQVSYHDMHVQF